MYKTGNVFWEAEEARGNNNMVWCELCYGEHGRCVSARQRYWTSQGFLQLKKQRAWKRLTKCFCFSNWLRKIIRVPIERSVQKKKKERSVHCSRNFGSSVLFSFIYFFPSSLLWWHEDRIFWGSIWPKSHFISKNTLEELDGSLCCPQFLPQLPGGWEAMTVALCPGDPLPHAGSIIIPFFLLTCAYPTS